MVLVLENKVKDLYYLHISVCSSQYIIVLAIVEFLLVHILEGRVSRKERMNSSSNRLWVHEYVYFSRWSNRLKYKIFMSP